MSKKLRNGITELVFILDRSGSMAGLERDTIGGFNAMIEKQKKEEGQCFVTTALFDNETKIIHDRVNLEKINPMTDRDYTVRGCTALMDAMGSMIRHIGSIHKYARKEDIPENTIFVITTDGMENASKIYDQPEVKRLIENQKNKYGWEFIFVAANIDATETARNYGIDADRTVDYLADSDGTKCVYACVSDVIGNVRNGNGIDENWSENIKEDYRKRK